MKMNKNLILLILIINLFIINQLMIKDSISQWIIQEPNTQSYSLHDIHFINRYTGWVCGEGIIKKTTNGGTNWIQQYSPITDKNLRHIFPVDSNLLYCVGTWEAILKTTNGGNNWEIISDGVLGQGSSYWSCYFLNKDTGWIAGSGWKVLRTYNGCKSFDTIKTYPIATFMNDVHFFNANTGLIAGETGVLIKSTNGGTNWFQVNIPLNGIMSDFRDIAVYNNQYCWVAAATRRIFFSSDYGSNWDSIGYIYIPEQKYFYCIHFASRYTGWVGGEWGIFYKTTNGGYTWMEDNTNNYQGYIARIQFYDTLVGWHVGGGGKILHTTTGGDPIMSIKNQNELIADDFELKQNYPNPFNSSTIIEFRIHRYGFYNLKIYDLNGKLIKIVLSSSLIPGVYSETISSENFSSGIYFYVMESNDFKTSRKFVILK